jgi:DNA-binding response OmpR family regulator
MPRCSKKWPAYFFMSHPEPFRAGGVVSRRWNQGEAMTDSAEPQMLLVEDEPLIRMVAADMLAMLGYYVLEAASGGEALAFANDPECRIDALMIDLGLPDQPGELVARRICELRPELPVIVTTGSDTAVAARRMDGCAVAAFLQKPYYFKDLEAVIATLSTAARPVTAPRLTAAL